MKKIVDFQTFLHLSDLFLTFGGEGPGWGGGSPTALGSLF